MIDSKTVSVAAGALLAYQGWQQANLATATSGDKTLGWLAVALGALLLYQELK